MLRTIILGVGWPVLIAGSVYLFLQGRAVYGLVKGSMIGRITKALVFTMIVEMYSLGIVCTAYMYEDIGSVRVVLPIFFVWFLVFVWTLRTLIAAKRETLALAGGGK